MANFNLKVNGIYFLGDWESSSRKTSTGEKDLWFAVKEGIQLSHHGCKRLAK